MANRNLTNAQVLNRGEVIICGSFAPNGSSAVDAASNKGTGWSVARTSAGLFTVTLQDKWIALTAAEVSLQLASPAAQAVQLGATDVSSAKTVQIRVVDTTAGTVADVAADASNRIHFVLRLRNSTVQPS